MINIQLQLVSGLCNRVFEPKGEKAWLTFADNLKVAEQAIQYWKAKKITKPQLDYVLNHIAQFK